MRKNNFALRLMPSLMAELRKAAAEEGVAVNQYINIAVAEKLAARRTAEEFFRMRAARGDPQRALDILESAGTDDADEPQESGLIFRPGAH